MITPNNNIGLNCWHSQHLSENNLHQVIKVGSTAIGKFEESHFATQQSLYIALNILGYPNQANSPFAFNLSKAFHQLCIQHRTLNIISTVKSHQRLDKSLYVMRLVKKIDLMPFYIYCLSHIAKRTQALSTVLQAQVPKKSLFNGWRDTRVAYLQQDVNKTIERVESCAALHVQVQSQHVNSAAKRGCAACTACTGAQATSAPAPAPH
ncbi:hypothetical protein T439DRAFT_337805 [Meredithblackwellia eburnea MCA 4105]